MKYSNFQKQIFEKYPVKTHKEISDIVIANTLSSIILNWINRSGVSSFKILDVGCGGGQLLERFAKIRNIEVYGVDISEKALKVASRRGYKVFLCDVETEKLPFPDNFFHIIVMNDIVEHIINPDNLLRETYRTLKREGKLIVSVPNVSTPASWFMMIFIDLPPMQSARYKSPHVRDYTLRLLKCLLKLNGFKIEQIKGTYIFPFSNFLSRVLANLFPRLSERLILICEKGIIPPLKLEEAYFNIKKILFLGEKL
jgi:methionine biosynthesis protein MetW